MNGTACCWKCNAGVRLAHVGCDQIGFRSPYPTVLDAASSTYPYPQDTKAPVQGVQNIPSNFLRLYCPNNIY
eukprot:3898780-Amphidinium_carterae.1